MTGCLRHEKIFARIRLALDDPEIWYPANRRSGWLLLIVGLVNIVAAVLLVQIPGLVEDAYGLWMSAILIASLFLCLILSVRHAKDLAVDSGRSVARDVGQDPGL